MQRAGEALLTVIASSEYGEHLQTFISYLMFNSVIKRKKLGSELQIITRTKHSILDMICIGRKRDRNEV